MTEEQLSALGAASRARYRYVEEHVQPTDPNGILTRDEVARWFKVRPRQVERLGVPCLDLGRRTKRYLVKDVLEWLQAKRLDAGRPRERRGDREALGRHNRLECAT